MYIADLIRVFRKVFLPFPLLVSPPSFSFLFFFSFFFYDNTAPSCHDVAQNDRVPKANLRGNYSLKRTKMIVPKEPNGSYVHN